jgi:outer membrane lipase/esterase
MAAGRDRLSVGSWGLLADLGAGSQSVDAMPRSGDFKADTRELTLGAGWRASEPWLAGLALTVSDTDGDFGRGAGGFDLRGYYLSAFAHYRSGSWFGQAVATLAPKLEIDDATRRVSLGPSVRRERGDTSGDALALNIGVGAELLSGGGLRAGPVFGLNYQDVRIGAYGERGNRSTSMGFLEQQSESLLLEAGLFADYRIRGGPGGLNLRAAFTREEELLDGGRDVAAYLKTMPRQPFTLYDIPAPGGAWNLDLSVSTALGRDVSLVLGYGWRSDDAGGTENHGSLGIQAAF